MTDKIVEHVTSVDGGTTEELERCTFAAAARSWLDHALGGDVPLGEAVTAARRLLERAAA